MTFLLCLAIFIAWGIIGSILVPQVTDPSAIQRIRNISLPIAFGLFLLMGFSMVPIFVRLFFRMFFGMQKAVGGDKQPLVQSLQSGQETVVAVIVYGIWILYALGTLIGAPFFIHDMLSGP